MKVIGIMFFDKIIYLDKKNIEIGHGDLFLRLLASEKSRDFVQKLLKLAPGKGSINEACYCLGSSPKTMNLTLTRKGITLAPSFRDRDNYKWYVAWNPVAAPYFEQWPPGYGVSVDYNDDGIFEFDENTGEIIRQWSWKELGLTGVKEATKTLPVYAVDDEGNYWALPVKEAQKVFNELLDKMEPVDYNGPAELWIDTDNNHDWKVYEKYKDLKKPEEHLEEYEGVIDFKKLHREFYGPWLQGTGSRVMIWVFQDDRIYITTNVTGAKRFLAETFLGVTEYSDWLRKMFRVRMADKKTFFGITLYESEYLEYNRIVKNFRITRVPVFRGKHEYDKLIIQKISDGPDRVSVKTGKFHKTVLARGYIKRKISIF